MSLDGRVALSDDSPPNQERHGGWTSPDDKEIFKANVAWSDFLVVGSKTLMQSPLLARLGRPVIVVTRGSPPIIPHPTSSLRFVVRPNEASLKELLGRLDGKKLLLCGGVMTYGTFFQFGLVDEVSIVIEPVILNSGPAFPFRGHMSAGARRQKFTLLESGRTNNGQTVHMWYKKAA